LVPNATDIKRLDPARILDFYSQQVAMLMFPPLYALDANTIPQPFAATGAPQISSDGLTWTITIKSGMKWTDGTPIDASVFAYSLNRSLDPCTKDGGAGFLYFIKGAAAYNGSTCDAPASDLKQYDSQTLVGTSIVATDPQTLTLTLEQPAAWAIGALTTTQSFAQPKQLIDQYGRTDWTNHLIGFSGSMFTLATWDHQGHISVTRNDGFTWGPSKPKLKEIDFTIYKDSQTEYADFKNGRLDIGIPPAEQYPTAKNDANFKEIPFLDVGYAAPNWGRPPFDDIRARQAFSLAINRDAIVQAIGHGDSTPSIHIVPQGEFGYNPNLTLPQGVTSTQGDQAKATALFQQYAADKCSGQISKCAAVTFEIPTGPTSQAEAQALQSMWQTAFQGLTVNIKLVDFNTLLDDVFGQASPATVPQLYVLGYALDYPDPNDWLSLQFGEHSPNNTVGINDQTLFTQMTACDTTSGSGREAVCNQAEQTAVNDVTWMVLDQAKDFWETNPNNKVINYGNQSGGMPSIFQWLQTYIAA
jgi:peptide/nickel transport system substrate-binding protein/oligopeptide transport system substrate-binding protein